jgi:hypothetical protein
MPTAASARTISKSTPQVSAVEVGPEKNKVFQQYVPPSMSVANRKGDNSAITLEDQTLNPKIIGVVIR